MKNVGPGQAVFIDNNLSGSLQKPLRRCPRTFCVFEQIYFAREDSTIHGRLVARERVRLGKLLARKVADAGLKPDMVIDVPSSGYFAASGLAEAIGVPYRRGTGEKQPHGPLVHRAHPGRARGRGEEKAQPHPRVCGGQKVAVVDDSIVRGTTSRRIVRLLREAGAAEVYFISSAPPIVSPCIYGIDMAMSTELIAANYTERRNLPLHRGRQGHLPGFERLAGAVLRGARPRRLLLRLLHRQVPHRRRDPLPAPRAGRARRATAARIRKARR
ncbi:MAG: hypothetical protein WKG07_14430 [Hymenobacter sp.]